MSEEKSNVFKHVPFVSSMTKSSLNDFPNVEHFFQLLLIDTVIETKPIGIPFQYSLDVERKKYFSFYGIFMDYFIRKHLSNQFNIELIDKCSERILNNADNYCIGKRKNLHDAIIHNYEIYKDPKKKAMDIIKSVKIVALSRSIFFREELPEADYTVDEDNLREIIAYFEKLSYSSVDLSPDLDCDYFNGQADIIFDNDVIYEIKTSKLKSLSRDYCEIPHNKFFQPILYGFGLYKKSGIKVKKFKIYNPLLAYEYSLVLDDIDYELFENVLKRDIAIFSRLKEIHMEMVLDLSLFPKNDN